MVDDTTTTIAESAENKTYTTSTAGASGTFSADASNTIYYPTSGAVDFIAYYPWKTGYTLDTPVSILVPANQTSTAQSGADLLWVKADNSGSGYTKSASPVALVFDHKLARLEMTLLAGSGVSDLTGVVVSVNGTKLGRAFNLANGAFSGDATGSATAITPRVITPAAKYDALLIPAAYADGVMTVTFTIGSDVYTWNVGAKTFDPGYEYKYTVTIAKSGVTATGTINPWQEGAAGNVDANN